jgi:uncharacterized protein YkwD
MNKPIIALIAITILIASVLPQAPGAEAREVRETRGVSYARYSTSTEYRTRLTSGRSAATNTRAINAPRHRVREWVAPTVPAVNPPVVEPVTVPEETADTTSVPVTPSPTVPEIIPEPTPVVPVVEEPSEDTSNEVEADDYLNVLAHEIHRLTNLERTKAGLAMLAYDEALAVIATGHSEDMAEADYFSHTTPGGCTLTCRFEAADYQASAWGENIAWRSSDTMPAAEELATYFVEMWMDSTGHRQNILSTNYTHEGIGLAKIGTKVYATANFATPR